MAFRHYIGLPSIKIQNRLLAPIKILWSHINIVAVAVKVYRASISTPPDSQRNTRVSHLVFIVFFHLIQLGMATCVSFFISIIP